MHFLLLVLVVVVVVVVLVAVILIVLGVKSTGSSCGSSKILTRTNKYKSGAIVGVMACIQNYRE